MNTLFPNHPAFVHFPLGLLAAAFFFELLGLVTKKPAFHDIGRANLFLGTLAALVAVGTGLWGEGLLDPVPPKLEALVDQHKFLGMLTASGAVLLTMWRVSLRKSYDGAARTAFVAALGGLAAVTLFTGHLGGRLVFDHGAAVTVGRRSFGAHQLPSESTPPAHAPSRPAK